MPQNKKEQPGCLTAILSIFNKDTKKADERLPYRLRDDFLSPAEFSFYKVLQGVLGNRFVIQSKVRLADLFFVALPNENFSYLGKIAQKHIDFIVCDAQTMKPLFGIELDDSSHQRKNRQERDHFVEEAFAAASFPLVRFPVKSSYTSDEIVALIKPIFTKNKPQQAAEVVKQQTNEVPLCPKCNLPMVLRTSTRGNNQGKEFFGCVNFPKCRVVVSKT
jgi:very-short-patch-repair endonuclease